MDMATELEKARQQLQLKRKEFEDKLKQLAQNTEMSQEQRKAEIKPFRDENQEARKAVSELEK